MQKRIPWRRLSSLLISQIIMVVIIFIASLVTVENVQSGIKKLQICSFENEQYAIIYRDENNVYLDRTVIEAEEKAIVYTDAHRIENVEGMCFKEYSFDEIHIVKD